ncbi:MULTISPECIES: hypothetical protein [unclassified Archaeoglobus]|jgi:hypothetical protein|uniref:hypothetical protein n=1 Tax=unclassified Archaeoglobus TaxID=2643606 RepID=UPI0025C12242|nr:MULTISPECIES: hypothetical protein [unclassified Archaeoglobus]
MKLLPRMGGVISIWLASTILGLKYFSILGILIAILSLFSVNPLMNLRKDFSLLFPSVLAVVSIYLALLNAEIVIILIFYSSLFALLKITRDRRLSTKLGALALTYPFPMMALVSGAGIQQIVTPLILLLSLTIFNFFLADSRIYSGVNAKNYLSLIPLAVVFYFFAPLVISIPVIVIATVVMLISERLTLRKFGFSLLFLHLMFAVGFLVAG